MARSFKLVHVLQLVLSGLIRVRCSWSWPNGLDYILVHSLPPDLILLLLILLSAPSSSAPKTSLTVISIASNSGAYTTNYRR